MKTLQQQPLLDAVHELASVYRDIRSSTRMPVSIYLQKPENAETLTKLVIRLNDVLCEHDKAFNAL